MDVNGSLQLFRFFMSCGNPEWKRKATHAIA